MVKGRRPAAAGRTVTTAAVAGLVLATAACGGGDADAAASSGGGITGSITFQTWSLTPTYQDYLDDLIADFEAAHPGAEVTLQDQPGDGYSDKVLTQASTGTLPDVVNLPPDFALPLAQAGMLDDVSAADPGMVEEYVPGAVAAYEFDGLDGVYAYPWYLNTDISYWNGDLMTACGLDPDDPPADLDELFDQAATYSAHCDDSYLLSRAPGIDDLVLAGVPIMAEDGSEFVFDTPEAAAVLQRYVDAYQAGEMPSSVLNDDYLGNATLFTEGTVAWSTGGAPAYSDFTTDSPALADAIVVTPALDTAPLYVQGVGVAADSDELATARAFAAFVTSAENQNAFARVVSIFPSTVASADDAYFTEDDGTTASHAKVLAFESLQTAELMQPVAFNDAMNTVLKQQIALALRGDVSASEALSTAVDQINDLLEIQS